MAKYFAMLLVCTSLLAAAQENIELSQDTSANQQRNYKNFATVILGPSASAIQLNQNNFNSGNISDPTQLVQGKLSGILIAKPSSDPNEPFNVRIRGINSINLSTRPLIIVDGMPYSSLLNVDPHDISKITLIKDASSAALFGLSSQNGVISIETFDGNRKGLNIRKYISFDQPLLKPGRAATRDEYLSLGGNDLGANTNWEEEITRVGISNVTHASYGNTNDQVDYYVSLNHRDVNGILENSGFKTLNGMAKLRKTLWRDKVFIAGRASFTRRKNSFSFPEAFRYAKTFIPTAPIKTPVSGEYAEYIIFENANPEAIVHQNINDGEMLFYRLDLNLNYKITDDFEIVGGYGTETQHNENRIYKSRESQWAGTFQNGRREQINQSFKTNIGFFSANYLHTYGKSEFSMSGVISYQELHFEDEKLIAYNFNDDTEGRTQISNINHFPYGMNRSATTFNKRQGNTLYRASMDWVSNSKLFLNANLSHEAYNNSISASAYGLSVGYELISEAKRIQSVKPKLSLGRTANALTFYQNYNPRDLTQSWRTLETVNLKPELKTEMTAGFDIGFKNVTGSVTAFTSTTKNIETLDYKIVDGIAIPFIAADAKIRNEGIEVDITWEAFKNENYTITTSLNVSTIKNTYLTEREPRRYQPTEFILYSGAADFYILENNKPVGQFFLLAYEGIESNQWKFKDRNNNGATDFYGDFGAEGQPLPSSYLGWSVDFNTNRFTIKTLFRGAFGHYVFNSFRRAHEWDFSIHSYNVPATLLKSPRMNIIDGNYNSDYYLEKGNYFTFDNLGVEYALFKPDRYPFNCSITFAVQNIFTITNYSGMTPEVRLNNNGVQYAAGFESLNTYRSARTFMLGINVKL